MMMLPNTETKDQLAGRIATLRRRMRTEQQDYERAIRLALLMDRTTETIETVYSHVQRHNQHILERLLAEQRGAPCGSR